MWPFMMVPATICFYMHHEREFCVLVPHTTIPSFPEEKCVSPSYYHSFPEEKCVSPSHYHSFPEEKFVSPSHYHFFPEEKCVSPSHYHSFPEEKCVSPSHYHSFPEEKCVSPSYYPIPSFLEASCPSVPRQCVDWPLTLYKDCHPL